MSIREDLEKHRKEKLDEWSVDSYSVMRAADISIHMTVATISYLLTTKLIDVLSVSDMDPDALLASMRASIKIAQKNYQEMVRKDRRERRRDRGE